MNLEMATVICAFSFSLKVLAYDTLREIGLCRQTLVEGFWTFSGQKLARHDPPVNLLLLIQLEIGRIC